MRRFLRRPVRVALVLFVLMTFSLTTAATAATAPAVGALGGPDSGPILHAVRIGNDGSFDRVVFEFFSDTLPESTLTAPAANPGTIELDNGSAVPIAGAFAFSVRMSPAAATYNAAGFPDPLYSGPTDISSTDTTNVVQVVETSDFEMVLVWAISIRTNTTPTVTVLTNPTRVVVDIPHAAAAANPVTQPATFTG